MEFQASVTAANVLCRLCGEPRATVFLTDEGWQCVEIMACIMRQPSSED